MLPKDIAKLVPKTHLLSETEWRNLGVQQSQGWVHYMIHEPGEPGDTGDTGRGARRTGLTRFVPHRAPHLALPPAAAQETGEVRGCRSPRRPSYERLFLLDIPGGVCPGLGP